jgi:hypothetical protein
MTDLRGAVLQQLVSFAELAAEVDYPDLRRAPVVGATADW